MWGFLIPWEIEDIVVLFVLTKKKLKEKKKITAISALYRWQLKDMEPFTQTIF